jgi:nucleoside-diphosphate-sugar epimerase
MSVYGGTGFIGSRYCDMYRGDVIPIARESTEPISKDVLYLISTVDNYNIFKDPYIDIETNLTHLVRVLESCRGKEGLVFNFVSSWFVYGKTNELPASESSHCDPRGFYSITKRAAEMLLVSYCETYKIDYRILRLANVYGVGDKKVSKKKNAMQHIVNEIVNGNNVNLYNGGENVRDFMHVDDVCRAINLVTRESEKNAVINIGTGVPTKIIEVANYVKDKVGSKSEFIDVSPPDFHKIVQVENMYLDVTKLSNLGFLPSMTLEAGIDQLIKTARSS